MWSATSRVIAPIKKTVYSLGMGQRHFQYQFGRVIKVVRIVTIGRDHQWQYVPLAALTFPAQLGADLMDRDGIGHQTNVNRNRKSA